MLLDVALDIVDEFLLRLTMVSRFVSILDVLTSIFNEFIVVLVGDRCVFRLPFTGGEWIEFPVGFQLNSCYPFFPVTPFLF